MSRFIRVGNTLINISQVRNIDHISPILSNKHKVRINYVVPKSPSGSLFFFSGPDNNDTWIFDNKKDAENFFDRVQYKISESFRETP